jgi:hypothetical protein
MGEGFVTFIALKTKAANLIGSVLFIIFSF